MKKINLTIKTIILSLIMLWSIISIIFYWIPYLFSIFAPFSDLETLKYLINNGCINKQELEIYVYSPVLLCAVNIICILYLIIMSILSYKNWNFVRHIGIGIVVQTFFTMLLKIWMENLVNNYNDTEIINLKYWLIISVVVCIVVVSLYILKKWLAYILLGISTILQVFSTIELFKYNIGFLAQETITNPYYLSIIFQCVNGIIIYILYWILLIVSIKSSSGRYKN